MELELVVDKWIELRNKYLNDTWHLNFTESISYFGKCHYKAHQIDLSIYHCKLNSDELIVKTLLHEIAHAILPSHGHDRIWKDKYSALINLELGINQTITKRFGEGKLPSYAEKKKLNNFEIEVKLK